MLSLLLACTPPTSETPTGPTLEPPPDGEGVQLSMEASAPPHSEVWWCSVYPIPTDAPVNVNWVQYEQTPGTHHMTLSTPGLTSGGIDPGLYPCEDIYGGLMEDAIMFFGGQGEEYGEMYLPEGVAATLPTGIDIVHEIHFVNTTDEEVPLFSVVNGWTIEDDEVVDGIWGGQVRDENIEIPPHSVHTEWSRCVMNEPVEVLFLASHTHATANLFTVAPFDGETTGAIYYENTDWHDPLITQYDPPLSLAAGEGFEAACTWENDTDETVTYGLESTDEMCNLTIVHIPFSMTARCEVVETSDGVLWKG